MTHAYQSVNSLLESENQICLDTSRLAIQLFMKSFNCLRSSPLSEYYFLKRKPNFWWVSRGVFRTLSNISDGACCENG